MFDGHWRRAHVAAGLEFRNLSSDFKRAVAFTLVELLVVLAVIAILAALLLPVLNTAKSTIRNGVCLGNLKQWGIAVHVYAADHDDYLPPEGLSSPRTNSTNAGWYTALPRALGVPTYYDMEWRTNAGIQPKPSLFICPSNHRRATNNNLFHYCLNEHLDGTGTSDRPTKLASIPLAAQTVYLFDNGRRAAVAQQNNVHTNLHHNGAQFAFLDAHAAWFRNRDYWDFSANRGRTNNPSLVWIP